MVPRSTAREARPPSLRLLAAPPARPTAEDDDRLARAFEQGEPGAGEALYDRLLPVVDATLVRVLGRREQDHADLVQSAFEQIVTTLSRRSYARGCTLAGWAAVLSCHVGLNVLRARRRERQVVDREQPLDAGCDVGPAGEAVRVAARHVEGRFDAREGLATVRRHLAEMDEKRATVLLLHAMGHELTEIAGLTQTSVSAAQSRLSRARRELRARVEAAAAELDPAGRLPGRTP